MKTIEILKVPEKVQLSALGDSIRALYPGAKVELRPESNTVRKNPADPENPIRGHTPAAVLVTVPEAADDGAIEVVIKNHKPEKSDADLALEARAAKLFDQLAYDPRMQKLIKLAER